MSEDIRVGMPAPGWRYDAATDRTRWWDGVRWTDDAKPLDPVVRTGPQAAVSAQGSAAPGSKPSTKNGPATAALVLLVLSMLGVAGIVWFASGMNPATATLLGLAQIGVLVAALVLSLVALVVAIRRPTRKRRAVVALVLSAVLLGFLVFRIATAPGAVDASALESEIAAWALGETGEVSQATCPDTPPQATGAVFTCSVVGASGAEWEVAVTVQADSVTWEPAP
ncbi:DUF4333 domain-containing protein [Microbacterium sp.]|uniref:DUF4333 domain-containing protein n=1 Tax=Microbacterium sp. TaxID=51671 RepID=UPI0035AEA3AA